MNKSKFSSLLLWLIGAKFVLLTNQYRNGHDSVQRRIRKRTNEIKALNNYEHQCWLDEQSDHRVNFYHLLTVYKFFWGGECNFIQKWKRSFEYGKDVLAEVLEKRRKNHINRRSPS